MNTETYKEIDGIKLPVNIYKPADWTQGDKRPAIVFFFGGGWVGGTIDHFKPQAEHFAQKGYVCFTPLYRTQNAHQTTPIESLKDARSAMRWVRSHAADLGIDPDKIVAGGGSAGGHLAAACAYTTKINEDSDNLNISPRPCALLLFNPVVDNGPGSFGYDRLKEYYPDFSPMHNVKKPAFPTLFLLGTKDKLIPVSTAEKFKKVTEENDGECTVVLYEDQEHGFFNKEPYLGKTMVEADKFMEKLELFNK